MERIISPHFPVLHKEVEGFCKKINPKVVIDCTFGGGGHSNLLINLGFKVIALDRDKSTEIFAKKIKNKNFSFKIGRFSQLVPEIIEHLLTQENLRPSELLILADLGTSVMQIQSDLGFSYIKNSPLHMTMDQDEEPLFRQLNKMTYGEIFSLLSKGQVKNAQKITRNICNYRLGYDILTSGDLVKATGVRCYRRLAVIFQAFRMHINQEIQELKTLLNKLAEKKIPLCIISFHSLERDLVRSYRRSYESCKELTPTEEEITKNSNSRSALAHCYYNKIHGK
jgi:16S rRNA (cytosine1402-N4)-methyltransferase